MKFGFAAGTLSLLTLLLSTDFQISNTNLDFFPSPPGEEELLAGLNECTTGLASGNATPDGRPLLWKNRDVGTTTQEFHYYDDGRIPFISITYSGETDEYYGGVNAEGFALENSNSYNLPNGPYRNGFVLSGDDDGKIHTLALSTCRSIDDFERLLDSTNADGRTLNSNYGAIDAFGGAAMFETGGYTYTRIDAIDSPGGFLVRSNYSYSGNGLNNRPSFWGPHRHDSGYELFEEAVRNNELTPLYLFQRVIRDVSIDGVDPYPLPFDGYYSNYPYGCLPNGEAICRASTRGIMVVQGVTAGGRPDDAILWAIAGPQLTTIATPVWVRSGRVPVELDGPNGSRICSRGNALLEEVYTNGNFGQAVDTWKLTNPQGTGLWDYILPLERWAYDKTRQFVRSPNFSYDRLETFQAELAAQIADSLETWHPTYTVSEITTPIIVDGGVSLAWGDVDFDRDGAQPQRFSVFRSAEPFRENNAGIEISVVNDSQFIDEDPLPGGGYYRVIAHY